MEEIGEVVGFFGHISVAAIKITNGTLKMGDKIKIQGHTTDFEQTVDSMQFEHELIQEAKRGDDIGLKVKEKVRHSDKVYKITEQER